MNSNQRYNGYLKEVANIAGIKKRLIAHTARHTSATTLTLTNGVPLETVSKMLDTMIYAQHKSMRRFVVARFLRRSTPQH